MELKLDIWLSKNIHWQVVCKETRRLISVISGLDTKQKRTSTSLKLLNWGYRNDAFEILKLMTQLLK